MAEALIQTNALQWAFERSGADEESVARRMGVSPEKVTEWLIGTKQPTFKQAQTIAKLLSIPFGLLFLPEPPKESLPLPEFRTLGSISANVDNDIRQLLQDIQLKREWFAEYLGRSADEKREFVGRYDLQTPALEVAKDMRATLIAKEPSLFTSGRRARAFLDNLMRSAEGVGVWVMRSGVVGNNTHRPLSVKAMRGFAVSDPFLPIVFLNGRDAIAAQIFTLAHELAHLWIGESDLSSVNLENSQSGSSRRAEAKCNAIAAEFLVPSEEFKGTWNKDAELIEQIDSVAHKFSVSRIVIAKRALDHKFIESGEFRQFYELEKSRWASIPKGTGGNFFNIVPIRNGRAFTDAVLSEALSGRMLLREASGLLGVKPSKLGNLRVR